MPTPETLYHNAFSSLTMWTVNLRLESELVWSFLRLSVMGR